MRKTLERAAPAARYFVISDKDLISKFTRALL